MLSFSHTLISLPFGVYLDNWLLVFILTFLFHLFCDTLLHWNIYPQYHPKYPYFKVACDVTAGVVAAWLLTGTAFFTLPILAAIAGGNAPDVLHGLWERLTREQQQRWFWWAIPYFDFHLRIQRETLNIAQGLVWQGVLVVVAVFLVVLGT